MALTMHSTEGLKNVQMSDLRGRLVQSSAREIWKVTNPANFNWPNRIPKLGSFSFVDPNPMYSGSRASRNRNFVVESKQWMMSSRSSMKGDSAKYSM